MTAINLDFKTSFRSEATFVGTVEASGASEYSFTGILKATCLLYRADAGFNNIVRLGHGGSSTGLTYKEVEFPSPKSKPGDSHEKVDLFHVTSQVSGTGVRAANETIDFTLGFNEGLSGQFTDGGKQTFTVK